MNKKEILEKLKSGCKVVRHIENLVTKEQLKSILLAEMEKDGFEPEYLVDNNTSFEITIPVNHKNNHEGVELHSDFRIDHREQDVIGTLTIRSKDYIFNGSFGDLPKAEQFTDNGFYKVDFRGNKISYTIVD